MRLAAQRAGFRENLRERRMAVAAVAGAANATGDDERAE